MPSQISPAGRCVDATFPAFFQTLTIRLLHGEILTILVALWMRLQPPGRPSTRGLGNAGASAAVGISRTASSCGLLLNGVLVGIAAVMNAPIQRDQ